MSYVDLRQEAHCLSRFAPRFEPPRVAPNQSYVPVSNSSVAREFANNFDYFQSADSGFVTRQTLEQAANYPATGNPFNDRMTLLAREILNRPEMSYLLDAINHNGQEDGLISQGDVNRVVDYYETQESAPMRGMPGRYDGAMQRHRVESAYGDSYGPQAFGSAAPNQMFTFDRNASPQEYGMSPQSAEVSRSFKGAEDSDLAKELGNNFDYFKPDAKDKITQQSLREVAGRALTGNPVDDRMTLLANEILRRPDFNRKLDSVTDGDKPDRIIGRDTVQRLER